MPHSQTYEKTCSFTLNSCLIIEMIQMKTIITNLTLQVIVIFDFIVRFRLATDFLIL